MLDDSTPFAMVVGVDGGNGGMAALRWACREAAASGAVVEAVHAWSNTEPRQLVAREVWVALRDIDQPPEIRHVTVHGSASSVLVSLSARAGLLVLGVGEPHLGRLTLGPVAITCRRNAVCPVVIIDRNGWPVPESDIERFAPRQPADSPSRSELEQTLTDIAAGQ